MIVSFYLFKILLVTSSKDRERFVVPGGGIEPQEDPKLTAEREALEEAGVRGDLGRYLGTFEVRMNIFVPSFYEPEN